MPVIEFTDNFEDLSTDQGFQFKFRCERCGHVRTEVANDLSLEESERMSVKGKEAAAKCPDCGTSTLGKKFCPGCGKKLGAAVAFCGDCGAQLSSGSKFCGECGAKQGG